MIENYEGENVVLDEATMQQLVCVINCKNATIHINTKVKNIGVDGCQKVNIVCHDVVSTVEFVNCENCKLFTQGKVHCISLDKCDGGELHLSEGSLQADVLTSKCVGLNVLIPDPRTIRHPSHRQDGKDRNLRHQRLSLDPWTAPFPSGCWRFAVGGRSPAAGHRGGVVGRRRAAVSLC